MLHELDPLGGGPDALRVEYLDRMLREASKSLDLTATQHAEAVKSYTSVGEWLDAPDSPLRRYRPLVYPQGSLPLGTLTKPLGRDDFDIDTTCVLTVPTNVTPAELKKMVGDRLRAHEVYREMLEEKTRCWRLNYARDFHLDIIPARPKDMLHALTSIYITDKELRFWKESDPKAYIAWFNLKKAITRFLAASDRLQASVEPAPEQESPDQKAPLQIAVQLFKRHRDVMFQGRDDAPISIILTTLASHAYQQEDSIAGTLRGVVERMPTYIDYSRGYAVVANPTITTENFADKWRSHPEREDAFYEWNDRAKQDIDRLSSAKGIGQLRLAMIPFLGEKRTDIVLNRLAEETNNKRDAGLKVDTKTGLVGVSTGIVVPRVNFYGNA